MPTKGRREWAQQAVECFLSQTYPEKELLIFDDLLDPSFPNGVPPGNRILRFVNTCRVIPRKRNELCDLARGEFIAHIDSDDWSAPDRLTEQVDKLETTGKAVTGYSSMLFTDGERAWRYSNGSHYAIGTSLCFRKSWWTDHRFPETEKRHGVMTDRAYGEDNIFVKQALDSGQLVTTLGDQKMVARIHPDNTSPKPTEKREFQIVSLSAIPKGFQ